MLVSRRLRLKPTKEQEVWLNAQAGVARFIYNWSLNSINLRNLAFSL